ncbi:hypothetical protein ASF57_22815 [Methylobacterium sp. Leaf117]|nr:hypothetical protein ASF57_22815 [Methylobacterium sp. Leaf117]
MSRQETTGETSPASSASASGLSEGPSILDGLSEPAALRLLPESQLQAVADAVRTEMIDAAPR